MNIFISAGDLSGDIHAAQLIREIKKIAAQTYISAQGGDNLKSVADNFFEDIVHINAFGFLPIKQFFFLKRVLKKIELHFIERKPDKIILVDYYGFHIHIAALAKRLNIPVYYYISPQVWASRSFRIEKLGKVIRKMLVIFPFEEKLYRDKGVDAVFVGNPLLDKVPQKDNFILPTEPLIGLFPGSRKDTLKRHIPVILETAKILKEKLPVRFIMFSANEELKKQIPNYIQLYTKSDFDMRKKIDIAISPSGTVSLENAFMGIPSAIMYKLSYFNYLIIRMIIKVRFIAIANILAD
ncbi:MAG: hypothetical protein LBT79_01080, partial [Elusimicrobiota bacterium]|nr:hypothetical protein [Elusimicrobiota bacterium]